MPAQILYVEDNPQNMDLVVRILRHVGGYNVVGAVDGLSGVEVAASERPKLIIMDINLPDISGLEATARIKSMPELSHIPIIAFTAETTSADEKRYIDAGCDGFMPKPGTAQGLLELAQQYVS